jgi:hypothetical protein
LFSVVPPSQISAASFAVRQIFLRGLT